MNLIVFVKHVPDTAEADLAVSADKTSIKASGLPFQMNEWDRFALEEAVRLKEQTAGTLAAFLLGPEESEASLRRCLAVGADRAVRVWDPALEGANPQSIARVLRAAVGDTPFDLALTGAQASDDGFGLVGPALADSLGVPSAALVNRVLAGAKAVCTRELEGGWGEVVELDLPALLTIQTGINEPRYVSVLGIRKAGSKPVDIVDLAGLGLPPEEVRGAQGRLTIDSLELPPPGREAEIIGGSPEEMGKRFVSILVEKGGVQ